MNVCNIHVLLNGQITKHKSNNYVWFYTLIKSFQIAFEIAHKSFACKWSDAAKEPFSNGKKRRENGVRVRLNCVLYVRIIYVVMCSAMLMHIQYNIFGLYLVRAYIFWAQLYHHLYACCQMKWFIVYCRLYIAHYSYTYIVDMVRHTHRIAKWFISDKILLYSNLPHSNNIRLRRDETYFPNRRF